MSVIALLAVKAFGLPRGRMAAPLPPTMISELLSVKSSFSWPLTR